MRPSPGNPAHDLLIRAGTGALRTGLDQLVRRNLRGVWVRGAMPTGPAVWASNHHSWWDYFVAASALQTADRTDLDVVMKSENIGNKKLFDRAGVIGTHEIRKALHALTAGRVIVIFPEGELRAPTTLGPTQPGAQWLARNSGSPLFVVATRVVLRGHQAAEAYLDVKEWHDSNSRTYEETHREHLQQLDLALMDANPIEPLIGFRRVVSGVRNWDERFGTLRARNQ